jgi:polysaccharide biosynthesis/export protein
MNDPGPRVPAGGCVGAGRRRFAVVASLFLLLGSGLGSGGCGASSPYYDYKREPDPRASEYLIGPLDQLAVVVWKNQELSAEVSVRPDGIITLPLVGAVKAAGRTPSDLQRELVKRYGDYVRAEEVVVSVGVTAVNSYQFTVSGNVEHSGVYTSRSYVTAVDALAMAGGPNRFAGDEFFVIRGTPARRIPIDLRRATSGAHPEENLILIRGDLIVVP